jgi:hypothetical protein
MLNRITGGLALMPGVAILGLAVVLGLTACLGGSGGGDSPVGTSTSPTGASPLLPPTPGATPILPPAPVGSFANSLNSPGALTTITTNTTGIANGDVVQITGSAGGAYDGVTAGAYDGVFVVSFKGATSFDIPAKFTAAGGAAAFQVIAAGSGPAGSTCPAVATAIKPNVFASRYSGVAPLTVFFDAIGTTHTDTTKKPFHDLEYQWDFDFNNVEGLGNWSTGSRGAAARKIAQGPVASHVYEKPGIYWVKVTIKDGNPANTVTDECIQIAVLHPDIVYSGTKTVCVDDVGVPGAGCPAGALPVTNADFCAAVTAHIGQNKRVLFNSAKTFSCGAGTAVSANGPWTIGSYPVVFGGGGNAKIDKTVAGSTIGVGAGAGIFPADGRIMNLEITSSNGLAKSITGVGNIDQLTLLRLNIHDVVDGPAFIVNFLNIPGNTRTWDQLAIVDSQIKTITGGSGAHGVFIMATRVSLLGNLIEDTLAAEHLVRLSYVDRAVVSYNTLLKGAAFKGAIDIRGAQQDPAGANYVTFALPAPSPTEYVVVSGNDFSLDDVTGVDFSPSNDTVVAAIQDVLTERNFYRVQAVPTCGAGLCASVAVRTQANRHTIRNEIVHFDRFKFYSVVQAVQASTGTPAASNIYIYNNSAFANIDSFNGNTRFANLQAGVSNVKIKNNLVYTPTITGTTSVASCTGGCAGVVGLDLAANSTDASDSDQMRLTNPNYSSTSLPPLAVGAWQPSGSYAIGAGAVVPVFSDFFLIPRTTLDLGAVAP